MSKKFETIATYYNADIIENIRHDIEQERQSCKDLHDWYGIKVIDAILKIFDKHLKEVNS